MAETTAEREVVYVPLNAKAKAFMEDVRESTGVAKTEAMSRIIEWFVGLDRKLQLAVLNRDEETRRELLLLAVSEMAGKKAVSAMDVPGDFNESLAIARAALDRAAIFYAAHEQALAAHVKKGKGK